MRKLLFVIPAYNHGGTNRSLMNILGLLDNNRYKPEVFCMLHRGPYRESLKKYGKKRYLSLESCFSTRNSISKDGFFSGGIKLVIKALQKSKLCFSSGKIYKRTAEKLSGEAQTVIAMQEGDATKLVSEMQAQTKIAWVRCDYRRYLENAKSDETEIYKKFDYIICVSEYTAEIFKKALPAVADKVITLHNIIDTSDIINKSYKDIYEPRFVKKGLTIVSVGRFDPVKRFSLIPQMALELRQKGLEFCWYVIGDGGEEKAKTSEEIVRTGTENEVVLLGAKQNPYPFIKAADIVAAPSFSEACPNVVNEARILRVPVASADFGSAAEYIKNGENGVILPIGEFSQGVYDMASELDRFKVNIADFEYDNLEIVKKIYSLFGE